VRSFVVRRALAFFLPVAVLATLCCGLVCTAVQQDLRIGANDPQLQVAEDAAQALDAGAPATTLVASATVAETRPWSPWSCRAEGEEDRRTQSHHRPDVAAAVAPARQRLVNTTRRAHIA
jgi:hypothetical protein